MIAPPRPALALGLCGLIPAVGACATLLWGPVEWRAQAATIGATYSAVILSFLGGAWWGIVSAGGGSGSRAGVFCVSVLPSLAGWAALLVDRGAGLIALGLLFLVVLPGDLWLARARLAPPWWTRLRVPLSLGMGALMLIAGGDLSRV